MNDYWNGYGHGSMGMGLDPIGSILSFLFFIVVVVLIVMVVRQFTRNCHGHGCMHGSCRSHDHENAIDTLKERYARGEIDTKEFEERRKALTEG